MEQPAIFHVTHWKAGSQWVRAVLEQAAADRIVKTRYHQDQFFVQPLVPGGIYTPLYAAQAQFAAIVPAGMNQRTFVVLRDLRDTLVSWYYSMRYSHALDGPEIGELRGMLADMDKTDGMALLLHNALFDAVVIQQTWLDAGAKVFRYEDLIADEQQVFGRILDFCEIPLDPARQREIIESCSFERASGRARGQEQINSHHRKGIAGDWRNHFCARLKKLFKIRYGGLLLQLGYEQDYSW